MGGTAFGRPDLLAGRYLLGDVIGRGGMGIVQRAWDTHLDRYVAVKLLRQVAMDPAGRARFRAEGKTLAALNHPGLITLYDAATQDDEPFLVMELVEGISLNERCNGVPMDVSEVASIGVALADALGYVHGRGVVHRDIKPSNVLLANDGGVKLADFGIARLVDGVVRHTESGITVGTAAYVSPEQLRDEAVTVASDIYSLGLVLTEALSGRTVFTGPANTLVLTRLTTSPTVDENLPVPLQDLLRAMTALRPEDRPTADRVAQELRALLGVTTPVTIPIGLLAPVVPATTILTEAPEPTGRVDRPWTTTPPSPRPTVVGRAGRSRLPRKRHLAAALGAGLALAAVLNGVQNDSGAKESDRTAEVGPGPAAAPAPAPEGAAPKQEPDPAGQAVDEGKRALAEARKSVQDKALEQAQRAEAKLKKAAAKAARKAAAAAAEKAGAALDEAWEAIQDAVTRDGKGTSAGG